MKDVFSKDAPQITAGVPCVAFATDKDGRFTASRLFTGTRDRRIKIGNTEVCQSLADSQAVFGIAGCGIDDDLSGAHGMQSFGEYGFHNFAGVETHKNAVAFGEGIVRSNSAKSDQWRGFVDCTIPDPWHITELKQAFGHRGSHQSESDDANTGLGS